MEKSDDYVYDLYGLIEEEIRTQSYAVHFSIAILSKQRYDRIIIR